MKTLAAILFVVLLWPKTAYAYLDAGTGSQILQIIIAAAVGGLFAVKIFWKKITNFIKKLFSK